jgi:hypothetical protein
MFVRRGVAKQLESGASRACDRRPGALNDSSRASSRSPPIAAAPWAPWEKHFSVLSPATGLVEVMMQKIAQRRQIAVCPLLREW